MRINGPAEFYQFIRNAGLVNIAPAVASFNQCMEEYQRMCNCDPAAVRQGKANTCKTLYSNFVSFEANNFKDQLLSKVVDNALEFWVDNRVINTITR